MWHEYPYADEIRGYPPSLEEITTRYVIESTEHIKTGILDESGDEITMIQEKKFGFVHFG